MEEAIRKLLAEYDRKIDVCDQQLDDSLLRKHAARHRDDPDSVGDELKTQAIVNAQKQAYIQAKCDIDSLLDVEQ